MPIETRSLFRPDVVRSRMEGFELSPDVREARGQLLLWAQWLESSESLAQTEESILPEFLHDVFCGLLGYRGPVSESDGHTMSREQHVEVDGSFVDAVLGRYGLDQPEHVIALEGKAPPNPLDRPFGGRRLSAVEQGYRYATNLPCDWIIVTNLREVRLYHKGSDQRTLERFDVRAMAFDERQLRRFVFLLGAERVIKPDGTCHLDELRQASGRADAELTQTFYAEYAQLRRELLHAVLDANPEVSRAAALAATQRLLDRVLFIAFCEDRGLLPAESLKRAWEHRDPYNPRPIWENFKGLFRAVEGGSVELAIPAYDGGLFAEDHLLDTMAVPDEACELLKKLGDYDFRSPEQVAVLEDEGQGPPVDVEILGHIFEQSISDLEELSTDLEAGREIPKRLSSRHRQGAFYTPAFVTRHIVGETVGRVVGQRYERLRRRHHDQATGTAPQVFRDPRAYDLTALNAPQKRALISFWSDWLDELATIRVLDPACGSGAFLIEAFDRLYAEYAAAVDRLDELRGQPGLFDPDRSILQNNLFGVDLSREAVEICRLSIWIKTARRDKQLTDLDSTIRAGNSIVDDPTLDPRALDWERAFPNVMEQGGFDVVLGNPPYVRQELLRDIKPHLEAQYVAYHGMADLYVYFFERGLRLLRPGGYLSFIVTNKWLRAAYAAPLRELLAQESWVQSVVDLGHAKQVFPDADVFPSIVLVRRPGDQPAPPDTDICVIPRDEVRIDDLGDQIRASGFTVARTTLERDAWSLEPPEVAQLMAHIRERGVPLKDYCGSKPYYGVKTGCNDAFLIDQQTRDRLITEDPGAAEILKPYLRGQDIDRWAPSWAGLWMIVLKSSGDHQWPWSGVADEREAERIFGRQFPSVHAHVQPFEDRLRKRQDQGRFWWELRSCSYYDVLENEKIMYQEIQFSSAFSVDLDGRLSNNKVFFLPMNPWLAGVLNSPLMWWHNWRYLAHMKDEALSPQGFKMQRLPVADPCVGDRTEAGETAQQLVELTRGKQTTAGDVADWLRVEHNLEKIPRSLRDPFHMDESQWIAAIRSARGRKRPLSSADLRAVRDEYHASIAPIGAQTPEIHRLEHRLSDLVNAAYGLTQDQINLMWQTAPPRMPIAHPRDGDV